MKQIIRFLHEYQVSIIGLCVFMSFAMSLLYVLLSSGEQNYQSVGWALVGVLVGEVMFIAGAIMMAVSIGESLRHYVHIKRWHSGFMYLRKNYKSFARLALSTRLFGIGFWLNFVGAILTSVTLICFVAQYSSVASFVLVAILVIDLVATFGWRIPIENARRRVRKYGN